MNFDEIKKNLEKIKKNPELLKSAEDEIDTLIGEVIAIERKHLYQVESTSNHKRLGEIRKLLDDKLPKIEIE